MMNWAIVDESGGVYDRFESYLDAVFELQNEYDPDEFGILHVEYRVDRESDD